jgi:surfeit locus 1 family protein
VITIANDRRDLIALVAALLVAGGCVRLGIWQLDRLHQRRAHNALVAAARARPELEIREDPHLPIDSLRDRRLHARGGYDYARERLWHGRSYEGIPGVDFVTPLRLSDSSAVLVDRGWASSPDGYHVDAAAYREGDSADVHGLGMTAPRGRGDVDPAALRDSVPYRLLPVVIQEVPSSALHRPPPSSPAALRRWPPPELSDGPHLSYVVQWFSFAVIIVVGSVVLLRQRRTRAPLRRGTNNALS